MSQAMKMMSLLLKVKTPSKPTKKDSSGSDDSSSLDKKESAPKESKEAAPAEPMKENEPVMKIKSIQNDYERKEDKKTIDTTPSRSQTSIMMIKKFKCMGMVTKFFFLY